MLASPGQVMMMIMMMMAWVWISSVTLARLNTAQEPHRDADGALASLEPLLPDIEPPEEPLSSRGFVPVPVWRFVKADVLLSVLERGGDGGDDGEAVDLGQPQYRCSDGSLSVRLSLIRHSAVSLEDGTRLLSLQDGCQASLQTFRPWLLINVPYTSCHMELWVSNGSWFHQLRLRYFDHLLQETVTGVAACENPATSLQLAPPLVTCRSTDVIVKLPLGARLTRVKALGKHGVLGKTVTMSSGTTYVQISAPANMRAKFPSQRPADQLILDRQKQDAARDKVLDFAKSQRSCDIKTSWLKSSERRFLTGTIERQVRAALDQQKIHVDERRDRLRVLLETEEQQLLQEMEEKTETLVERQAKMRQQVKTMRDRRERDRQQLVSEKLEQLFRGQCEELRSELMRRREQQVCQERAAQVRSGQEQRRLQQQEERMFDELWEADRRAKVDRETERVQRQQQRNRKQLDVIRSQMEEAEQQRQRSRELRAEEAALMLQQQQMQQLQQQRQQQTTLQQQQGRRRQLDQCLRLKMKRLAREQQDELQLDMNILQTLLQQETDDKQEAAHKKAELREEQRRYRQYLSEELQKQRREEEETEQLMEEKLKEVWAKREEQSRLQREARNRLMEEVMEARRLQIQHKLDLNTQKQAELSAERDELNRVMEEMKLMEEEDRRCQKQSSEAYQADLKAQIEAQQWRHSEQRAQEEREQQQGVILQQLYEQRKDHILSRPTSHASAPHPFRRTEGCTRSASRQRHTGSACAAPRYSDGLYE